MASKYGGYMGQALWVDLTTRETRPYEISDHDRELFIGNKGLAAKILWDNLRPGIDPLGPENLFVITTAPLTGTGAPCSARFNASCKSPLTGGITSSNCGGSFGIMLKKAGYDALIVAGAASGPVYIEITEEKTVVHDAADLWGLDTEETQEELIRRHGKYCGRAVIGPAGENLVRYACVMSGERALGRGGVGAVMGSKMLKAIVATGKQKVPIPNPEPFKEFIKGWIEFLRKHPVTGEALPKYGTASHLNKCSATGVLPTRNYSEGSFEHADEISGEALAEKHLVRNDGCQACPIRCARVVNIKGKEVKGPEYETMALFGSNLGNRDLWSICEWNYLMDKLGIDTISAGVVIGFATELTERGVLQTDLKWGKTEGIDKLLKQIAYREGLGNELAEGVMRMAEKFGGMNYALHGKGLEFAAYEPRRAVGMGLGYATANRGACHLNSGFLVYFEALGPININPQLTSGKVGLAVFQQNTMEAISAVGTCIFTSYAVIPGVAEKMSPYGTMAKVLDKTLRASGPIMPALYKLPAGAAPLHLPMIPHSKAVELITGMKFKAGSFLALGNRVFNMERMFNAREHLLIDALPKRLTDEEQIRGRSDTKVPLAKMLPNFYRARGWDERGVPSKRTLKFLGLDFAINDIPEGKANLAELQRDFQAKRFAYEAGHAKKIAERRAQNQKLYSTRSAAPSTPPAKPAKKSKE